MDSVDVSAYDVAIQKTTARVMAKANSTSSTTAETRDRFFFTNALLVILEMRPNATLLFFLTRFKFSVYDPPAVLITALFLSFFVGVGASLRV